MRITDPTKLARVGELVDKGLGYPKEADMRGTRCPAAPFGRTERYNAPADRDGDGFPEYELPTNISDIVRNSNRLTAQERAEFITLLVGAIPGNP